MIIEVKLRLSDHSWHRHYIYRNRAIIVLDLEFLTRNRHSRSYETLHLNFWIPNCIEILTHIEDTINKIRRIVPEGICKIHIESTSCFAIFWDILLIPIVIFDILLTFFFPSSLECQRWNNMSDTELFNYTIGSYRYSDQSLECWFCEIWIDRITCRLNDGSRKEEEIFFLIPDKCFWIPENIARWTNISQSESWFLFWIFDITHIIEVDLDSSILSTTPR